MNFRAPTFLRGTAAQLLVKTVNGGGKPTPSAATGMEIGNEPRSISTSAYMPRSRPPRREEALGDLLVAVRSAGLACATTEARWTVTLAVRTIATREGSASHTASPTWPIFCTMVATAAPWPMSAASSGFAHAIGAGFNGI